MFLRWESKVSSNLVYICIILASREPALMTNGREKGRAGEVHSSRISFLSPVSYQK